MSTVLNQAQTTATEGTTPSPTVTRYQQLASEVSASIAKALSQIAPLEAPHPSTRDFVRANSAVGTKFIAAVIAAVEESPELQGTKFDVAEARDMLQFLEAFQPVLNQIAVL